jgi:hypothetical protein
MKKALLFLSLIIGFAFAASAQVCTPDSTHFTSGVYVYPSSLPCITQGVAYTGTVSIKAPDSVDVHALDTTLPSGLYYVHLDSMVVDSVTGFPAGITAADYPTFGTWLPGGAYGCSTFSGTTGAVVGSYSLAIHGRACGHGTFPILGLVDTCMALNFSSIFPYSVSVCAPAVPPVCTPDSTHFAAGQYVYPDSLPCITRLQAFSGNISIMIPDSVDAHDFVSASPAGLFYFHIDSMEIDSITGVPNGISVATNPLSGVWLKGGQFGCALFTGTTSDPAGAYRLNIYGRGCGHGTFPIYGTIDSCTSGNLGSFLKFDLNVCNIAGISEISNGVNLNIYPNPNQGAFTVTIASADHISGQMSVLDQLGRSIHTQELEVTGTKQIPLELGNIAPGVYMLMINTGSGKSVREFVIR